MPRRPVIRDEKAISPVIATVIIVAVAIVMSIAVAYWVLGLTGTFTRYEKLEIVAMYATSTTNRWDVTAKVRNTGSATATINMILINGRPIDAFQGVNVSVKVGDQPLQKVERVEETLNPGDEKEFVISIPRGPSGGINFVSGMSIEITFHTAAGSDYPKVVVLP